MGAATAGVVSDCEACRRNALRHAKGCRPVERHLQHEPLCAFVDVDRMSMAAGSCTALQICTCYQHEPACGMFTPHSLMRACTS